jgi:hypothetical protein
MLREAKNVTWAPAGRWWSPRMQLVIGREEWPVLLRRRAWEDLEARQAAEAVPLLTDHPRRYWWHRDRFYWEDDGLDAEDVLALIVARDRQDRRRLDRAHALLAVERAEAGRAAAGADGPGDDHAADAGSGTGTARTAAPPAPRREGIPRDVKLAVWQRCGGACTECGATHLLEFDHIIPVAMGGSSGERNLQLLCADCNRAKGASL